MRLLILHPEISYRDCGDCQTYVYDEKKGERLMQFDKPMKRPPGNLPPCRMRKGGCPKGTPEEPRSLTDQNWRAYQHYSECRAVGQFPADPIVRRNAAIIRQAEDAANQELNWRIGGPVAALMGVRNG